MEKDKRPENEAFQLVLRRIATALIEDIAKKGPLAKEVAYVVLSTPFMGVEVEGCCDGGCCSTPLDCCFGA